MEVGYCLRGTIVSYHISTNNGQDLGRDISLLPGIFTGHLRTGLIMQSTNVNTAALTMAMSSAILRRYYVERVIGV
jgi:hypothetical protein